MINNNLKNILSHINKGLFLTKAIFFDKPAQSNWYVTWHQDMTIHVMGKIKVEGFDSWTKKGSFFGVRPPENILLNTITVRVHLDDTSDENGALKVIPGSHKKKLADEEIRLITDSGVPTVCEVSAGGIQLMKPLLLHASSKTTNNKNRRVIHMEFNSAVLPGGLKWAEKVDVF